MGTTRLNRSRGASGGIVPPPVIYAGVFLTGYLLHRSMPIHFFPDRLSLTLGSLLIFLSIPLVALSLRELICQRTAMNIAKPAATLVVTGPFRFTRNPMYLSVTLLYCGLGVSLDLAWVILLLPLALVIVHYKVIVREEVRLERQFGQDYLDYKASVRRWL